MSYHFTLYLILLRLISKVKFRECISESLCRWCYHMVVQINYKLIFTKMIPVLHDQDFSHKGKCIPSLKYFLSNKY